MNKNDAIIWADKKLALGGETDGGCTMSPDFNFKECCLRHDVMINYNQGITDREADRYLRECIIEHGHPVIAWVYWFWVRISNSVGGALNAAAIGVGLIIFLGLYYFG